MKHVTAPNSRVSGGFRVGAVTLCCIALAACGGSGESGSGTAGVSGNAGSGALAPTLTRSPQSGTAFDHFNTLRMQSGVPPLTYDARLYEAAARHSAHTAWITLKYGPAANPVHGEIFQAGVNNHFTSNDIAERILAAGFPLQPYAHYDESFSFVNRQQATPYVFPNGPQTAEAMFAAIYHRFSMLTRNADSGALAIVGGHLGSAQAQHSTLNLAASTPIQLSVAAAREPAFYPFSGQIDAPRSFESDEEMPDPVPASNTVGYPISVQLGDYCDLRLQATHFVLWEVLGNGQFNDVPVWFLGAGTAPSNPAITDLSDPPGNSYDRPPKSHMRRFFPYAVSLIPRQALKPAATYQVQFDGEAELLNDCSNTATVRESWPVSLPTWQFTTAAR